MLTARPTIGFLRSIPNVWSGGHKSEAEATQHEAEAEIFVSMPLWSRDFNISLIRPVFHRLPEPNRAWLLVVYFSRYTSQLSVY